MLKKKEVDSTTRKYQKTFNLVLSNMENRPQYPLSHQLTIGSEIGNIIIHDQSISPRHATFYLKEGILSLVDHGSLTGTHLNGTKVPPGKNIIIEETDKILVGDLELEFLVAQKMMIKKEELLATDAEESDQKNSQETKEESTDDLLEIMTDDLKGNSEKTDPDIKINTQSFNHKAKVKVEKTDVQKKVLRPQEKEVAGAIMRIISLIFDLLLTYAMLILLTPISSFHQGIRFVKDQAVVFMGRSWSDAFELIFSEAPWLKIFSLDMIELFHLGYYHLNGLYLFFFLKIIGVLLLGTTFSQYALGLKSNSTQWWSRLGGVLRTLLEIFTTPFLIFDVPSIFSKKTLKEVLTFTSISSPSLLRFTLGGLLYLPLLLAFFLMAPLIKGFELIKSYPVHSTVAEWRSENVTEDQEKMSDFSEFLKLNLSYSPESYLVTPQFSFTQTDEKKLVQPKLSVYFKDKKHALRIELWKEFDFKLLLMSGIEGDYFLQQKFPLLHDYLFEVQASAFKKGEESLKEEKLSQEVISLITLSLGLNFDRVIDDLTNVTPFLENLVFFKEQFLLLLENKDFESFTFIKIQDMMAAKIVYPDYDLFMPFDGENGRLYKVTFVGEGKREEVENDFYFKFLTSLAGKKLSPINEDPSVMTASFLIDEISKNKLESYFNVSAENLEELAEKNRELYQYYFTASQEILSLHDQDLLDKWKEQVAQFRRMIELVVVSQPEIEEGPVETLPDLKQEFLHQLSGLQDALEMKNESFFGLTSEDDLPPVQ